MRETLRSIRARVATRARLRQDSDAMLFDCSHLIAANPARPGFGVAVTDVDGDGAFELLVAGHGVSNLALKWDGHSLVDVAEPLLADPTGQALGLAAADLDGDGREEIYIVNCEKPFHRGRQSDRLLAAFGNRWLDLFAQVENQGLLNRAPAGSVSVIDRNGHGRYGFIVANRHASLSLVELDRTGRLVNAADEAGLDLPADTICVLPVPLIAAEIDLFVANEDGPNYLFHPLGDGTYEELAHRLALSDSDGHPRGAAMLDSDTGPTFHIVCGSWGGPQRLFVHTASGRLDDGAPEEMARPGKVRNVVVADFDNDGLEEIFFNLHGQPNRLFAWRDDQWMAVDLGDASEPDGFGTGAAVADIDGDGHLELLLSHGDGMPQPLSLFKGPPNDHAWLRVLPMTASGAPARGARVTLTAGDRVQHRMICAGSGYLCQMEPVAHFGLGERETVDRLEVSWPDGVTAVIDSPPPRRLLPVPHPPG